MLKIIRYLGDYQTVVQIHYTPNFIQLCFNHAVQMANEGFSIEEIISEEYSYGCEFCKALNSHRDFAAIDIKTGKSINVLYCSGELKVMRNNV